MKQSLLYRIISFFLLFIITVSTTVSVFAEEETREDLIAQRQAMEAESNSIPGWPQGPVIAAESACLIDADSGAILYAKNMDKIEFPASTTKVMTCLLAAETCSMNEIVKFSKEAVFGIERDSSNVGMDVGQSITMEQAIYCVMLASANEVASAIAEHVAGSIDDFAIMMNEKAKELGCTNTHFVNANGLHNDEHYTTAHDLALITAAYFKNEQLRKIASTTYYEMHATKTQPDEFGIGNHHKMLPGKAYAYENIVGGKTGYTVRARQTLTTCAEKNGMTLICSVMRDDAPYQYTDTRDLFEYGFSNFKRLNIAENESNYNIDNDDFFKTNIEIFGGSSTSFVIAPSDFITVPANVNFEDVSSTLVYNEEDENILADLVYTYKDLTVGYGHILMSNANVKEFKFGAEPTEEKTTLSDEKKKSGINVIFVNVKYVIMCLVGLLILVLLVFIIQAFAKNYSFSRRRRLKIIKNKRRYKSEFEDFDF